MAAEWGISFTVSTKSSSFSGEAASGRRSTSALLKHIAFVASVLIEQFEISITHQASRVKGTKKSHSNENNHSHGTAKFLSLFVCVIKKRFHLALTLCSVLLYTQEDYVSTQLYLPLLVLGY